MSDVKSVEEKLQVFEICFLSHYWKKWSFVYLLTDVFGDKSLLQYLPVPFKVQNLVREVTF